MARTHAGGSHAEEAAQPTPLTSPRSSPDSDEMETWPSAEVVSNVSLPKMDAQQHLPPRGSHDIWGACGVVSWWWLSMAGSW